MLTQMHLLMLILRRLVTLDSEAVADSEALVDAVHRALDADSGRC